MKGVVAVVGVVAERHKIPGDVQNPLIKGLGPQPSQWWSRPNAFLKS